MDSGIKVCICFMLHILISNSISAVPFQSEDCRYTPEQPCWPSEIEWSALNETVSGNLIIPISPVDLCINGNAEKDPESCQAALNDFISDPFYLETFSGGIEPTGKVMVISS